MQFICSLWSGKRRKAFCSLAASSDSERENVGFFDGLVETHIYLFN